MVHRREILKGAGLLLGLGVAGSSAGMGAPAPASTRSFKAIVRLGGKQYVYDGATGDDMGDYVGEFVRQHCTRVVHPELPLTVFFRPDVSGDRAEVVVELGRMWSSAGGSPPAHIIEPYSVEIIRGDRSLDRVDVPYHWWWARWRWQSSPRPVVRTPASLIARGLLPPYASNQQLPLRPYGRAFSYDAPMDLAGIGFDWGNTGERDEIGALTEPQADYVIHGTSAALSTLLAQAEASASAPMHWRDERTGTFINFQHYKSASINENDGRPLIPNPPIPMADGKLDRRYTHVETSHTPALSYLPFLLTDDPYFLEELQCLGELAIGFGAYFRDLYRLPGLASPHQTRGFAWSMRSLFQLGIVSPQTPPRWLLPKSYWQKCVADSHAYMQLYMNSPARIHKYFRVFPVTYKVGAWQASMVSFILGWGVMMGHHDWKEAYQWFVEGQLAQCNGRSGWNREWPTPYYWYPLKTWKNYDASHLFKDTSIDAETCLDWSDAWRFFKSEEKIDDSGWDGHTIMEGFQGPDYYLYLQGALRMAEHLGVSGAKPCVDFIDQQLPRIPGEGANAHALAKWSIARA
jgi:hypothetical protein